MTPETPKIPGNVSAKGASGDPGPHLQSRSQRSHRRPRRSPQAAHMGPRLRLAPAQSLGLSGCSPVGRLQTHLQLFQRRQPALPRRGTRLLLPLRALPHPRHRLRHPRPRRSLRRSLHEAPQLPRLSRPPGRLQARPRDLQPNHHSLLRRQTHLRPRSRPMVRLRRILRHPGHPERRL